MPKMHKATSHGEFVTLCGARIVRGFSTLEEAKVTCKSCLRWMLHWAQKKSQAPSV